MCAWCFLKETLPTMVSFKKDPETDIERALLVHRVSLETGSANYGRF